jgi:hypothetical protein
LKMKRKIEIWGKRNNWNSVCYIHDICKIDFKISIKCHSLGKSLLKSKNNKKMTEIPKTLINTFEKIENCNELTFTWKKLTLNFFMQENSFKRKKLKEKLKSKNLFSPSLMDIYQK